MAQPDFYHLEVDSDNVKFTCFLNGFPVYSAEDTYDATISLPIHLYLIGQGNKLSIEAEAIDQSKIGTIKANIVAYQQGDIVATDAQKDGETSIFMEVNEKTSSEAVFNNDRFDFSKTLTKGDKLTEKQVMDYAKKLHSYLENGDAAGFVKEMELKVLDYSSAHEYTAQQMRDGLTGQMKQSFFAKKSEPITEDRITANSFNEDRIWEIKIDNAEFLKYSEDGGSFQMGVYVGSVNGNVGIVR